MTSYLSVYVPQQSNQSSNCNLHTEITKQICVKPTVLLVENPECDIRVRDGRRSMSHPVMRYVTKESEDVMSCDLAFHPRNQRLSNHLHAKSGSQRGLSQIT